MSKRKSKQRSKRKSEQKGEQKAPVKGYIQRVGHAKAWILGIGAVAGAFTAVVALIFMLVPSLKPIEPSPQAGAILSISRVERDVTFGEYLQRPWVPNEGAVETEEQLEMVGNVFYLDVEFQGFAGKQVYARYTVYDADSGKPINGLTNRSAWPSDVLLPRSQTSKGQNETWVPVPLDGSGSYVVWIELYTIINDKETRLASDEEKIGA